MLGKELQCVSFGGHKNSADLALKRLEGEGYSIQRRNKAMYSENNQKHKVIEMSLGKKIAVQSWRALTVNRKSLDLSCEQWEAFELSD